ncbi:MAG: hypothetical protein AB7F59_09025 [Bdellovibrionales bacterium]
MKSLVILFVIAPVLFISCASEPEKNGGCKSACESRGRHSSAQIANCKQMCDKYN